MESGLPPTDTCEKEWERIERNRIRKSQDSEERMQRKLMEQQLPPNGVKTTALPRPNSYIPPDIRKFFCQRPSINSNMYRNPQTLWSVCANGAKRARIRDASHRKAQGQRNRILIAFYITYHPLDVNFNYYLNSLLSKI